MSGRELGPELKDGEARGRAPAAQHASRHVTVVAPEHPSYGRPLVWRVLDVGPSRSNAEPASWHRPPHPGATGRAYIAADRDPATGLAIDRKIVRVLDRHPQDDWDDTRPAALEEQLARAYIPPLGWIERHGRTGVGWRRDRGVGRGPYAAPSAEPKVVDQPPADESRTAHPTGGGRGGAHRTAPDC